MSAADLLAELTAAGVTLTPVNGKLRFRAPLDVLTEEHRTAIAEHRDELLTLLTPPVSDVAWRCRAMQEQIVRWLGSGIPFLIARPDAPLQPGHCLSCGEQLQSGQRYRCRACVAAAGQSISPVESERGAERS